MKRKTILKGVSLLAVCALSLLLSCSDEILTNMEATQTQDKKPNKHKNEELTVSVAKQWYEANYEPVVTTRAYYEDTTVCMMKPKWDAAKESNRKRYEVVELPVLVKGSRIILDAETAQKWEPGMENKFIRNTAKIVIEKDKRSGAIRSFFMVFIGSYNYLKKTTSMGRNSYLYRQPDFEGSVLFYELNGTFINGWKYTNGKITASIAPKTEEDPAETEPESRAWTECYDDCYTIYDEECYEDTYVEYDEEYGTITEVGVSSGCIPITIEECTTVCETYYDDSDDEDNWEEDYPIGGSNTSHNDGNNDNQQSEPVSKDPIELMDKSKFVGWHNGANCLTLAQQTLKNYGITNYGSSDNVFRLVYEHNGKLENWGNDPKTNYENAIRCIDEHLNANRPIIVGVDYIPGYEKNEGTTDHFVVITGRGYDNATDEYYYTFMDNATSNADKGCSNDNRFYYTEGLTDFGGTSTVWEKEGYYYTVSQVRPNNGKQYETTSATN